MQEEYDTHQIVLHHHLSLSLSSTAITSQLHDKALSPEFLFPAVSVLYAATAITIFFLFHHFALLDFYSFSSDNVHFFCP